MFDAMNQESAENPFRAPTTEPRQELRLKDGQPFLIGSRWILCREDVTLPPLCIRYGDDTDVIPRKKVLRIMSGTSVVRMIGGAVLFLILPIILLSVGRGTFLSPVAVALISCVLLAAFGALIWWSARHGTHVVRVKWYICARYRRHLRLQRTIVWLLLLSSGGFVAWLFYSLWSDVWPSVFAVLGSVVLALSYRPERKLVLRRKWNDAFIIQGHHKAFYKAALAGGGDFWGADHSDPSSNSGDVLPDV